MTRTPTTTASTGWRRADSGGAVVVGGAPFAYSLDLEEVEEFLFPDRFPIHGHPLSRDEDYENAITPHAPHDGVWRRGDNDA